MTFMLANCCIETMHRWWTVAAHQSPDQAHRPLWEVQPVSQNLPSSPSQLLSPSPLCRWVYMKHTFQLNIIWYIFPFQVFNLAAPTPVMNGVGRADGNETEQIEKATKLTEKEENNNKKNKRPLEEEKAEETRKKAATDGGPKPVFEIPSFGGNSDFSSVGGSPKAGKVTSGGSSKLEAAVTQTFTFRPPTTVITQVLQSLLFFGCCLHGRTAGIPGSSKCWIPLLPPHAHGDSAGGKNPTWSRFFWGNFMSNLPGPGWLYYQLSSSEDSAHSKHSGWWIKVALLVETFYGRFIKKNQVIPARFF